MRECKTSVCVGLMYNQFLYSNGKKKKKKIASSRLASTTVIMTHFRAGASSAECKLFFQKRRACALERHA